MQYRWIRLFILAGDLLWAWLACELAFHARTLIPLGNLQSPHWSQLQQQFQDSAVIWICLYIFMRLDCLRDTWESESIASRIITACLLMTAILLSLFYGIHDLISSRLELFYFLTLFTLGVLVLRAGIRQWLLHWPPPSLLHRVLLLGEDAVIEEVRDRLRGNPLYQLLGQIRPVRTAVPPPGATTLRPINSLELLDFITRQRVDEIFASLPESVPLEWHTVLERARKFGVRVHIVPHLYELYVTRTRLLEVSGMPMIVTEEPQLRLSSRWYKRAFDLLFLIPLLPLAVLLLFPVWLRRRRQGRPFLQSEWRCGIHGKLFRMWRLAPEGNDETWWERGRLRELPQLWNVARGQMSLIGPRPEAPEKIKHYSNWTARRLLVKPGIAGLAQVHGMRDHDESLDKARFDLQYVLRWSPLLDLILLVQTLLYVVRQMLQRPTPPPAQAGQVQTSPVMETINAHRA